MSLPVARVPFYRTEYMPLIFRVDDLLNVTYHGRPFERWFLNKESTIYHLKHYIRQERDT